MPIVSSKTFGLQSILGCKVLGFKDGLISIVRCKVCIRIERKENLLVLKMDFLSKHVSKRKGKGHDVVVGKWYFAKDPKHAKNEVLNASFTHDFVLTRLTITEVTNNKRKLLQYRCISHLLNEGHPTMDYEGMKVLFK